MPRAHPLVIYPSEGLRLVLSTEKSVSKNGDIYRAVVLIIKKRVKRTGELRAARRSPGLRCITVYWELTLLPQDFHHGIFSGVNPWNCIFPEKKREENVV